MPRSLAANLIPLSDRGEVFTDFAIERQAAAGPIGQSGAGFRRSGRSPIRATVNGGGPDVELRTYASNVDLRRGR